MCYFLCDKCPINGEDGKPMVVSCPEADVAGYCEMERTGPGLGSGKYLAPVHRSLFRIAPCKVCIGIYEKEKRWMKKDGTVVELDWLKPGLSCIVDPLTHVVREMAMLRAIFGLMPEEKP